MGIEEGSSAALIRTNQAGDVGVLQQRVQQVAEIAHEAGLRPFPTQFITAPAEAMYEVAAYGLPGNFSHWSRGRDYYRMKTQYDYGLSKIYELVINSNPSLAFLLETNAAVTNTLVAAHVLAHVDFFANNPSFVQTNRQMVEAVYQSADRIDQYRFQYGEDTVDGFLDAALTIDSNFDQHRYHRPGRDQYILLNRQAFEEAQKRLLRPSTPYDDLLELGESKPEKSSEKAPFPYQEEPDLLYFIANFSPLSLESWQVDCLDIIRAQGQYFLPQMKTKIMNEGWATYWHVNIMRKMGERGYISDSEATEWFVTHAGVVAADPLHINPYHVGSKIWQDINRRNLGIPREGGRKTFAWWGDQIKEPTLPDDIFAIRASTGNDQAFWADYLTPALIDELELYIYGQQGEELVIEEKDPTRVKSRLLESHVNFGLPVISVAVGGGDYHGNRELYLRHAREEHDLDLVYAERVLRAINQMWGRTVHLETITEKDRLVLTCQNGKEINSTKIPL